MLYLGNLVAFSFVLSANCLGLHTPCALYIIIILNPTKSCNSLMQRHQRQFLPTQKAPPKHTPTQAKKWCKNAVEILQKATTKVVQNVAKIAQKFGKKHPKITTKNTPKMPLHKLSNLCIKDTPTRHKNMQKLCTTCHKKVPKMLKIYPSTRCEK